MPPEIQSTSMLNPLQATGFIVLLVWVGIADHHSNY